MESSTAAAPASKQSDQEVAADNGAVPEERLEGEELGEQAQEPLRLEIPGEGQLTLTVGGAKPDSCTVKLVGGKMDVADGDFDKGAPINLLIKGVVTEVSFVDRYDQYGQIAGTERRHKVRPFEVERVRGE